jgi:hypothetical protein
MMPTKKGAFSPDAPYAPFRGANDGSGVRSKAVRGHNTGKGKLVVGAFTAKGFTAKDERRSYGSRTAKDAPQPMGKQTDRINVKTGPYADKGKRFPK